MTDLPIDVVYATDRKYLRLTAASIHSLVASQKKGEIRDIFVLCGQRDSSEIEKSMRKKLGPWTSKRIQWVGVEDKFVEDLPVDKEGWLSPATYLRLYAAEELPRSVNLLYLDADVMVRKSLGGFADIFAHMRRAEIPVAARTHPDKGDWQVMRQSLGLNSYFNAGVLAINAVSWRDNKIASQIAKQAEESAALLRFSDQDILNLFFSDNRADLPPDFNFFPSAETGDDPTLVHFIGAIKPSLRKAGDGYSREFQRFIRQTYPFSFIVLFELRNALRRLVLTDLPPRLPPKIQQLSRKSG